MSAERLLLSDRYKTLLRCDAPVESPEGIMAVGKTTVGLFKFMLKVAESSKKLYILAMDDTGTAEKNIIQKDLSTLDDFGVLVECKGDGGGGYDMPHTLFHTSGGDKIIFVVGYGNERKWKDALGGQYGCLYIDEINTAGIEFVRGTAMRSDHLMTTLNLDDPGLDMYKEYINCSRPLLEWEDETPKEITDELQEEPKPGWVHWFFPFVHNLDLSREKLDQTMTNTPKGTKIWKNKTQGLRGKATGLILSNFEWSKHIITAQQAKTLKFKKFTAALDTSYSNKSSDAIAMTFQGIMDDREPVTLVEKVYNNAKLNVPLASSDTTAKFVSFLEQCRKDWSFVKGVYTGNANQAIITEPRKYKRLKGCLYNFWDAYKQLETIGRTNLQLGWTQQDCYLVVDTCVEHLSELDRYSWDDEKDKPENRNDHIINANRYVRIPYRNLIGFEEAERK